MKKFGKFELKKNELRKIKAGTVYVFTRFDGEQRTFETDNPELGRSWLDVQRNLNISAKRIYDGLPRETTGWDGTPRSI